MNLFSYAVNIQQPLNKLYINQDVLHNCATQANIEDKIYDATDAPRSDKFKLGSFPRGWPSIQRSTCTFTISPCTSVRYGVANVQGFGCIRYDSSWQCAHIPRGSYHLFALTHASGRFDLLLFDFRSYVTHSVEWGLLRTCGRQQIFKVFTMTPTTAEGNIKQAGRENREEDWTIGLHINANICIGKSPHLFSSQQWINI